MKISLRYKKGTLRTQVVRKIEHVCSEDWNRLFPDVLEDYHFFKTLDESGFDQFSFYYILVYENKQLVGAAPCFAVNYSLDTSISGRLRRISNAIRKALPNLFSVKTLVCGIPMGQGHIGLSGDCPAVLAVITRRMEQLARKIHAHILAFKDFDHADAPKLAFLKKNGFLRVDSLPTTELVLSFTGFEDYMKTLSAATRYDLRRKFKKAAAARITMTAAGALDNKTLEEAYRLYRQTLDRHETGFEVLPDKFFPLISQNMPQQAKYFLWRIEGKLVAFLFCLVSDTLLIDYFIGLDYAVAHEYHLYFVKFRDVMDWCFAHGIKKYEMGVSIYEPKRRLGFDFVPRDLYVKVRYRWLNPLFRGICALLRFDNFDPELKQWRKRRKQS